MRNGNSIMLLAKSMGTALDDVELGIGIGPLCLPGIIQLHDIVLRSMDDQYRAVIGLKEPLNKSPAGGWRNTRKPGCRAKRFSPVVL